MEHTCNRKPSDEGRILPDCSGCYFTAHGDGRLQGIKEATQELVQYLTETVRNDLNPLTKERREEAMAEWKNGQRFLKLVDKAAKHMAAGQRREMNQHFEETHVEPAPAPAPEPQAGDGGEATPPEAPCSTGTESTPGAG